MTSAVLQTACQRGYFPESNPHEEKVEAQVARSSPSQKAESLFKALREETNLVKMAETLLSLDHITNPDSYLNDDFEFSLFRFQEMVLKEINQSGEIHSQILQKYRELFLTHCDLSSQSLCTHINTLSRQPQTHRVALWMAERALKNGNDNDYWRLLQISINLRGRGIKDPTLALYFAENIQKIRYFIEKESPEKINRWNNFLSSLFLEISISGDHNNIKQILELIEPEKLNVTRADAVQFDREILLGTWSRYYKQRPDELSPRLKVVLYNDPQSLYYSKHSTGLFRDQAPEVSLCSFLVDRIFTGALDSSTAQNLYNNTSNGENCEKTVAPYLLARLLFHSSVFFKEIKTINESIKIQNVANADLLENLTNRMPDYGKQWVEILDSAHRVVDMATISFTDGDVEIQKKFRDLKKSLRKNVVMYIQFPMNLSFLSVLSSYKNQTFGQYSILTNNIATLIKKLIDRGDYFLDFGLLDASQRRLSYPEILAAFDFAVYSNIFESVGSSDLEVLTSIAENLEIMPYNHLSNIFPEYYRQYEGDPEHAAFPLCKQLSRIEQGKEVQSGFEWNTTLKRIVSSPLHSWTDIKGLYFNTYPHIHEDLLDEIQQEYLVGLRPLIDFSKIIKKHKNLSTSNVDDILEKRKSLVKNYVNWVQTGIEDSSECTWAFMNQTWKTYSDIVNYEAEFIGLIHDEMTRLRENSNLDIQSANQKARIFLERSPIDEEIFFDRESFTYFSLGFFLRMAGYMETGAFGKVPIAPYIKVEKNFNEFSQKQLTQNIKFSYNPDKMKFVEQVLKYLMLPGRTGGIWSASFLEASHGEINKFFTLFRRLYLLNASLFGIDDKVSPEPLIRSGLRVWDNARIDRQSGSFDQEWILETKNLHEKFSYFGDQSGPLAGLYFINQETRAPLHFLIDDIIKESALYPIDYNSSTPDEDVPELTPETSTFVVNYYQDRSSMPTSLYPYDRSVIASSDAFHNQLISHRFEKIKSLVCKLKKMKEENLLLVYETRPDSIHDPLSLHFRSYQGQQLIENEEISLINTNIYNFLQKIPEDMRESGPKISLIENCEEDKQ